MQAIDRERLFRVCRVAGVVLATASFWYIPGFLFAAGYSKVPFFTFGVVATALVLVGIGHVPHTPDAAARRVWAAWLIFGCGWLLAAISGTDAWGSFIGSHLRQSGGLMLVHFGLLAFLLPVCLRDRDDWAFVWWLNGGMGIIAALYGLVAALGVRNSDAVTVSGWFGNPLFFSGTLLLSCVALGIAGCMSGRRGRIVAICGVFFLGVVMVCSGSRSAILGLGAGAGVFAVGIGCVRFRQSRHAGRVLVGAAACVALVFGLRAVITAYPIILYPLRQFPISRILYPFQEMRVDSARSAAWGIAWSGFLERPLLGWGPEQFSRLFDQRYPPSFFRFSIADNVWDKPHNLFLEWLATGGIVLWIAGCCFFALLMWSMVTRLRQDVISPEVAIVAIAGMIAMVIYGLFVFETFFFWMFFALLSGFIQTTFPSRGASGPPAGSSRRWAWTMGACGVLVCDLLVVGLGGVANVAAAQVVAHTDAAARARLPAMVEREIDQALGAFHFFRVIPEPYRAELTRHVVVDFLNQEAQGRYPAVVLERLLPAYLSAAHIDRDTQPAEFAAQYAFAQVAVRAAEQGMDGAIPLARDALDEAVRISPERQPVALLAARLDLFEQDYPTALARINHVVETVPNMPQPLYYLFLAYLAAGDLPGAGSAAVRFLDRGGTFASFAEVQAVVPALVSIGATDRIYLLYLGLIQNAPPSPDVAEAFIHAAKIYQGMSDAEAQAVLEARGV